MRRDETGKTASRDGSVGPDVTWSDDRLIRACLNGNEQAWSALIDKYKNLIYSIPMKYGASPEDAADIFQVGVSGVVLRAAASSQDQPRFAAGSSR